jgi:hypothetical protein
MGRRKGSGVNFVGKRFGRLLVLEEVPTFTQSLYSRHRKFKCQCDCGNQVECFLSSLKAGSSKSCGCYNKEMIKAIHTTHGLYYHPLYPVYSSMIDRCYSENFTSFRDYGGRGISMCDEWRGESGLENFITWEESLPASVRWRTNLYLDRIDNNDNYSPENCRFVTAKQSSRNKRNTIWVTWQGQKVSFVEVWEEHGNPVVSRSLATQRYRKLGWSIDAAISVPPQSLRSY